MPSNFVRSTSLTILNTCGLFVMSITSDTVMKNVLITKPNSVPKRKLGSPQPHHETTPIRVNACQNIFRFGGLSLRL